MRFLLYLLLVFSSEGIKIVNKSVQLPTAGSVDHFENDTCLRHTRDRAIYL